MVTLFPGNDRSVSNKITSLFACVLTLYVGVMMVTIPSAADAEDKSTSISCDGVGTCEKTECVDGVCDTGPTNSSSIVDNPSPLSGADDKDSAGADNTTGTTSSPLDQRLDIRENLKR
jgi:hypothetical protein